MSALSTIYPIDVEAIEGYHLVFEGDGVMQVIMPHSVNLADVVNTSIRSGDIFQKVIQLVGSKEDGWKGVQVFVDISRLISFQAIDMRLPQKEKPKADNDNVIPFPKP